MKSSSYQSRKEDNQGFIDYSGGEHAVWKILFERQAELILQFACVDFINAVKELGLSSGGFNLEAAGLNGLGCNRG
jgi:phenylalanine-4-hydroxylase